ncbi:MAG TPA: hypothetical protein VFZ42_13365 [Chitinophagaceae bacterium]
MKSLYACLFALIFTIPALAQFEAGGSYSLSIPQQEMAKNIQPLHSLNGLIQYRMPGKFSRATLGTELGIGIYAYETRDQDLRFPDGSGTSTTIVYTSNVFHANLFSRLYFFEKAKFNPYITGKAGYANFFSNVTVGDPEDEDDCRPLEKKNIIRDDNFFLAWGGGFQIDLNVFSKKQQPGRGYIDLSINQVSGGKLDYINTKNIQDHVHVDPNAPQPMPGKGEPLNVKFVNVSTQAVHEHQVAEVHNSALRMLDIKLGVVFKLD